MSKYHNQNKMQPETNLSSYTIVTTDTLIYQQCIHSVQMIFYAFQYLKSPIQNYLIRITL